MAPTRDSFLTIKERIEREPSFAHSLWEEGIDLFLEGEPGTARLMLRDIVKATLGFEGLSLATSIPSKSLHRMLSHNGNPNMENLATIFKAIQNHLQINTHVTSTAIAVRKPKSTGKRHPKRAS